MKKAKNRGFTLIELLVVISIVSVLSSTVLVALNGAKMKGRDAMRITQIKEVQKALALYYLNHGVYPDNSVAPAFDESIPRNWVDMITPLNNENLIKATVSQESVPKSLALINIALAAVGGGPVYYGCSIQDPLYKTATDYQYSYGYVVSADKKSYKIRFYLEGSALLSNSVTGTFLDANTTGQTACDSAQGYYCVGSTL
jgi:prepilin-type N-terminal cleavage/methylation domain-containing protein